MTSDVLLPPWVKLARVGFRYIDSVGVSVPEFSGVIRTGSNGGDRTAATLEFTPTLTNSTDAWLEQRALKRFLLSLRGRLNRALLFDPSHRRAGSFPASELLTNNTFASGTTGWTAGAQVSLAVADRVLRATRVAMTSAENFLERSAAASVTAYAPYVGRFMVNQGRGAFATGFRIDENVEGVAGAVSTGFGMKTQVFVPSGSTLTLSIQDMESSGVIAGDYVEVSYVSLSRCALADNGPNALLQSDEFDTSWTATRASVDDQTAGTVAPDGTSTADSIIEDSTASNSHFVTQDVTVASAAADYAYGVCLKQGARTWGLVQLTEATGSTSLSCFFNLATGATGTASAGANWANVRTFVVALGNGWYYCCIVGRKTNAATTLSARVIIATADNNATYTGDGTSNIYAWRATLAQSSVPMRLTQTVATAAASGTAQTSSALHVKGLPASTNGLLLPGDPFAVMTSRGPEMNICVAPLNSDAAGLGYLQGAVPVRGTLSDNAAVVVHEPMGRYIFTGDAVGWDSEPGTLVRASAEFTEN